MPLDENAKGVNHALGGWASGFFNGLLDLQRPEQQQKSSL
jgi:hypothetical protein